MRFIQGFFSLGSSSRTTLYSYIGFFPSITMHTVNQREQCVIHDVYVCAWA